MGPGSGVRANSPKANIFLQKICYFIDILKHSPVTVAKKKNLAAGALISWLLKKKKKKKGLDSATF